jgi:hypothetical protein
MQVHHGSSIRYRTTAQMGVPLAYSTQEKASGSPLHLTCEVDNWVSQDRHNFPSTFLNNLDAILQTVSYALRPET